MKKTAIATALALSAGLSGAANADFLGFTVGANNWQQEFSGTVRSGAIGDTVDIENDLGYSDDEGNNNFYVAFEHPVPLIPNVMLARTELEVSAENTLTKSFDFEGVSFSVSDDIRSTADLTHTDLTLYYEILDNWVSLDIGFTLRSFEEGFTLTSSTESAELSIDGTLPMFYVGAKFELPFSGLYVIANGNWISYDDDTIMDYKAALGYESSIGLGVEIGMRSFELEYEDDEEYADLTIDGMYAGVFYHF
mgnify:CR=1 FL=1